MWLGDEVEWKCSHSLARVRADGASIASVIVSVVLVADVAHGQWQDETEYYHGQVAVAYCEWPEQQSDGVTPT